MPYPEEDDGMIPDFDPSMGSQSVAPTQPDVGFGGPQFNPGGDDQEGEDLYTSLPTQFIGGLDHLRARRQRPIDKMLQDAQMRPIYQDEAGGYTKVAPEPYISGEYRPMEGAPYRTANPSAVPVQYKMAQDMQHQYNFPTLPDGSPLSDAMIYQNAPNIWNELLKASGGNMNAQNFMSSPYWDKFRGLDNDTLATLKTTVAKAVNKNFFQPYIKTQKLRREFNESMSDPDTGEMFMRLFTTTIPDQGMQSKFLQNISDPRAAKTLTTIKEKAELLSTDPDAKDLFEELSHGNMKMGELMEKMKMGPDSITEPMTQAQVNDIAKQSRYYDAAMRSPSGSTMSRVLNSFAEYKQKKETERKGLVSHAGKFFEDASGADQLSEFFRKNIESGYYDGRESELKEDLKDAKTKNSFKINGQQIPGAKDQFEEASAIEKIETYRKNNYADTDIFITADRKVLAGAEFEAFKKRDVQVRFPDSGPKGSGKFIALPADIIKDENDNVKYLTLPSMGDNGDSPISYVVGDKQYVLREVFKKLGFSQEELSDASNNKMDIIIARTKQQYLTDSPTPYETKFINASQFMDEKIPNGQRFLADKEMYAQFQEKEGFRASLMEKDLIMTMDPTSPTFLKEAYNGLVRGTSKIALTSSMVGLDALNIFGETIKTAVQRIVGDEEGANGSWGRVGAAWQSIKDSGARDAALEEAMTGDFWNMAKHMADPNAEPHQKIAGIVGEIGGSMIGIAAEMAATGGLGTEVLAAKLTEAGGNVYKSVIGLKKAAAFIGKSSEIAAANQRIARAGMVTKEMLDFVAQQAITGHVSPTELAQGGAYGLILGLARVPGRGFFSNKGFKTVEEFETATGVGYREIAGKAPHWYADAARLKAASAAAVGVIGLDAVIKSQQGLSSQQIIDWWKEPENIAGMALQLAYPFFGANVRTGVNMKRSFIGPPHAEMIPRVNLLDSAARKMTPDVVTAYPRGKEEHYTHGSTDLHEYWRAATTSEMATRARILSDQIGKFANGERDVPESLILEFDVLQQNLLGSEYRQGIILKDAKAKDLEQWGFIKKMLPALENKEPAKEVKLLGLQKTPEGPQVSEVTKMKPSELTSYINTVRDNPVAQYNEAGKFNAAIKRLIDFKQSPEFDLVTDKGLIKSINNIVKDENLLIRASRPESIAAKLGDDIVDPKSGVKVNSKDIENVLAVQTAKPEFDAIKDRRKKMAQEKAEKRMVAGHSEVRVEKTKDGWIARARLDNRSDKGIAEHLIPNSKEMTASEAKFLADEHFSDEYYLHGDKMQGMVAEELYGDKMSIDISDSDREVAHTLFSDAFEKGDNLDGVVKKLQSDKYGFSKEDVDSMLADFVKDNSEDLGKMRDFLGQEFKDLECE